MNNYEKAGRLVNDILERRGYANPWAVNDPQLTAVFDQAAGVDHEHHWRYVKNHDECFGCSLTRGNTNNERGTP